MLVYIRPPDGMLHKTTLEKILREIRRRCVQTHLKSVGEAQGNGKHGPAPECT